MRVIVTGSRSWYCPATAELVVGRLVARHGAALVIVHGAAEGVDRAFAEAAEDGGVEVEADPDTILELQLVTNALREEVAPVEQARAYQRLIDARGLTRRQLGEKLAIDQSAITKALALLDLPVEVQARVDGGELPASTAAQIARLDDPAEQREMAGRAVAEGLSRAEVAAAVERTQARRAGTTKDKAKGKGAESRLVISRRFRFPGGLIIEATRVKGLEPTALAEAFR